MHFFVRSRPLQIAASFVLVLGTYVFFAVFIAAPGAFPVSSFVSIENGETLNSITDDLTSRNIIDRPSLFKLLVRFFGGDKSIKAGDYYFEGRSGIVKVAFRLTGGRYGIKPIKITVPEGYSVYDIGTLLSKNLPHIQAKAFAVAAKNSEGYLFPDTYYILPSTTSLNIITLMKNNFDTKIAALDEKIKAFGRPLKDVVIMASILEEEARTDLTRKMIAGILWKRLSIGMPLQVDAAFQYVNGKNTYDLTLEDLQADSPYNTYKYKGLPPTAISNPGLAAIEASVTPIQSKYLYYLSDKKGNMHYATTFEEHKRNRELYLH